MIETSRRGIDALLRPRSIALVGLPRGFKAGKVFLLGLLDQGFSGPVYPVHPSATEIDGIRTWRRLADVPDPLDMVIVMAPRETVGDILVECGKKKVQVVILYTSGYGETGEEEARREQERLRELAHQGGFRLLGPNCMGVYSPSSGLACFPGMPRQAGPVGFLSQSGSLCNLFTSLCASRGVYFDRVVSYGNGCDLDLPELLQWTAAASGVGVVAVYCEGVRNGRALAEACRNAAQAKPIVFWKAGQTAAGRRAAASHTGSLSGEWRIWEGLFRQCGIQPVQDIEEMFDLVLAFCRVPEGAGCRIAVMSGPGGPAVSAADAVERNGLRMASLSERSLKRLREVLPPTGTSVRNPIDVGLSASFDIRLYLDTLEVISEDPGVDAVVAVGGGATPEISRVYVDGLVRFRQHSGKAVLAIAYPGFLTEKDLLEPLHQADIPVYPTPERALRAYGRVAAYFRVRAQRGGQRWP